VVLKNTRNFGRKILRFRTKEYVQGLRRLEFIPSIVVFTSAFFSAFAVRECNILNIPSTGIVDSNVWASEVFFPIFGNDDSVSSTKSVLFCLAAAFRSGRSALVLNYFGLIGNFILKRLTKKQ
jgi:small subunit ribosomal protein S2